MEANANPKKASEECSEGSYHYQLAFLDDFNERIMPN